MGPCLLLKSMCILLGGEVAMLHIWRFVLIPLLLLPVPDAAGPLHSLQHHHQLHGHQGGR